MENTEKQLREQYFANLGLTYINSDDTLCRGDFKINFNIKPYNLRDDPDTYSENLKSILR